jgi:hypothetical protein
MGGRGGGGRSLRYVTLYHRTSAANADAIMSEGFKSAAEQGGGLSDVYFSTRKNGVHKASGSAIVSVRIPEKLIDVAKAGGHGGYSFHSLSGERDVALSPSWMKGLGSVFKPSRVK